MTVSAFKQLIDSPNSFIAEVSGNSMSAEFAEGTVFIVENKDSADEGDLVICEILGYSNPLVKKIYHVNHSILLCSTDSNYPDFFFDSSQVKVIGIVKHIVSSHHDRSFYDKKKD